MKFSDSVYKIVTDIPKGSVMTYGQVAAMLGGVHKSRAVGWALRALTVNEQEIPWWRVVNRLGYLSINQGKGGVEKEIQKDYLIEDGIEVNDRYEIDLGKYLLKPLN